VTLLETAILVGCVVCFAYLVVVYALYALMVIFSALENAVRHQEMRHEDYATIEHSPFTPPVSVIVPIFDEGPVLAGVLDHLLALRYPEWELIVVDDGSGDGSIERLHAELDLEPYHVFERRIRETEPVGAIYRSTRHPHVRVVVKANGGKADALNCGLNHARYRYVCTLDGDTIYSPDALLQGMRLAARDPGRVVGVTSHIGVADLPERWRPDSGVELIDSTLLSNFQHLEYLRSFLNNRLAWSRFNAMLCSSGAFSIWRRDVLEEVGGFSRDFTCEDIEMTFRVHELHLREKRPYQILSLPTMVAKTEAPGKVRALVLQRARWQRACLETMWHYRRMLGRRSYGNVGTFGLPLYAISEGVSPAAELLALAVLVPAAVTGLVSWPAYAVFAATLCFANGILTAVAVLLEDMTSRSYRLRHIARLVFVSPLELLLYRPIIMWARMRGTFEFLRGDRHWGAFERNTRAVPR
jgi:cellulose synthase/poly-beta-1,6-N-acetylglucosamine synthase-like glycosyltransferase